jgi:parvulin-like peptidyl-prolyl isomerase
MIRPLRPLAASGSLLVTAFALVLAPAFPSAHLHAQEVLDGLAAVVNNDPITFSQVRDIVSARENNARANLKGQAQIEEIKKIRLAALNELIDRQLILQEFKKMQAKGAAIPPHVIDEHVETIIREQFGNDRQAFIRTLAAQGFTLERFRQIEEEKIIVQAMRGQKLGNGNSAIVAEPRIREYYDKNRETYSSEEQMHLRMLVLRKSAGEGNPRQRMMEEIREKIVGGAAFEDLARMYDEGSSDQANRGDWGWIGRHTLNETLTKEAFKLKPGQVSQIIDIDGNYYLLYCEAKKAGTTRPLSEVRDEIEKKLIQEDRQKQQREWLDKLRSKAYIHIY